MRRGDRLSAAEELSLAPTGEKGHDAAMLANALAQVWMDNYAVGPLGDYRDWDRLRTDWDQDLPAHPGWAEILRETIERLPDHPGPPWTEEGWQSAIDTLIAEWLLRGSDSILPLLRDLIRPDSRPVLVFRGLVDYFSFGRYPLTPAIRTLLLRVVDRTEEYADEPAEWFVSVLEDAGARDLLAVFGSRLSATHVTAQRNYEGALQRMASSA